RHTRFSRDWSSDVCSSDLCFSCTACTVVPVGRQWSGSELCEGLQLLQRQHLDAYGSRLLGDVHQFAGLEGVGDAFASRTCRALRSEERRVGKGGWAWEEAA